MNTKITQAIVFISAGLLMMVIGFIYQIPIFTHWDTRLSVALNRYFQPKIKLFRYLWRVGTNPMAFILIGICFIPGWQKGLNVLIIYVFISALERIIKINLRRKRPYQTNAQIRMEQPVTPHDPSHPSGDAMRIWFLAIVFPWIFSLSWQIFIITCCTAVFVSIGRICLGVHYPLDIIGGKGLGILGAGITILLAEMAVGFF